MATQNTSSTEDGNERILVIVPRALRAKLFQMAKKDGSTLSAMTRRLLMRAVEQETP